MIFIRLNNWLGLALFAPIIILKTIADASYAIQQDLVYVPYEQIIFIFSFKKNILKVNYVYILVSILISCAKSID